MRRRERTTVGAVVLCGGASARMGFPKLLLDVGGRSALAAITTVALEEIGGSIVVVTRAEDAEGVASSGLPDTERVQVVVNPEPERGRTGSIQCGLRELPSAELTGCLIWPVDVPLVTAATVRLLAEILIEEGPEGRVVPTMGGRGGHPVAVGRAHWPDIHDMQPAEPLRNLFGQPGRPPRRVPVEDRGIRANLNAQEDVLRWLGRPPSPWSPSR